MIVKRPPSIKRPKRAALPRADCARISAAGQSLHRRSAIVDAHPDRDHGEAGERGGGHEVVCGRRNRGDGGTSAGPLERNA
jgi:hypothetical protein